MIFGPLVITGAQAATTTNIRPRFSWQETTFSFSIQKIFDQETQITDVSDSYNDSYSQRHYTYSDDMEYIIKEVQNVDFEANFTTHSERVLSGNYTLDVNLNVYQVSVNYGTGVNLYWFAVKKGTFTLDRYYTYLRYNYSYYEENRRHVESTYYNISLPNWEVTDTWTGSSTIPDEINHTHFHLEDETPYAEYIHEVREFSAPMILTVQMYTTENRDKIAWANYFNDFVIYEELDQNSIYSCGNVPGNPAIYESSEFRGFLRPIAYSHDVFFDQPAYGLTFSYNASNPFDVTVDDIASGITFTPPTALTGTEIVWGIDYPNFPLDIQGIGGLDYWTPQNASYIETTPTSLSYDFDYSLGDSQAEFDMTWEIGKIANQTLYDKLEGYGLAITQYNYFLGTFDIAEVDQAKLTVPQETFTFISNNSVVAEINMEKPGKENYTIYDFLGSNVDFESKGGSIHPNVIDYNAQEVFWDYSFELNNLIYSLGDFVAQDTDFVIADDLFRIETQNYPVWGGNRFIHDPSLSIYYATPTSLPEGIPGYNLAFILGVTFIVSVIMVKKLKKPKI
jgi:hypothetical protein